MQYFYSFSIFTYFTEHLLATVFLQVINVILFLVLHKTRKLIHGKSVISEAVVQRCFVKKLSIKTFQSALENTCARVSFLMKFPKPWGLQRYYKKRIWHSFIMQRDSDRGVFLWILRNFDKYLAFESPPVTTSEISNYHYFSLFVNISLLVII